MGLKAKGYVGYSNYYYTFYREKGYDPRIDSDTNQPYGNYDDAYILDAHGIQYGAELAYIWDFLDKGKHTIGLDIAPIGFEGSTYFGKLQSKYSSDLEGLTKHNMTINTYTKFAYTASIGLHYYYNVNHQVFFAYKIRSYSTTPTAKLKTNDTTKISNTANHALLLGYAYKF